MPIPDPVSNSRPPQMAGGCLIAAGLTLGPVIGLLFGQTTLGLLIGFGVGAGAAIVMAIRDKR